MQALTSAWLSFPSPPPDAFLSSSHVEKRFDNGHHKTIQELSLLGTVREAERSEQYYLPEPLDNGMVWAVTVFVDGVLSPVVNINIAKATHQ